MSLSENHHTLAKRLKQARLASKLKQRAVAVKTGFPVSTLSAMENAKRRIEAVELFQLAVLYNKPFAWFFSSHPECDNSEPVSGDEKKPVEKSNAASGLDWTDPISIQCFNLLSQAPLALKQRALRGLLGFLSS